MTDTSPDARRACAPTSLEREAADAARVSPLSPPVVAGPQARQRWGRLYGCSAGLVLAEAARNHDGLLVVITPDMPSTTRLETDLRFFVGDNDLPIAVFPDWETLPYDMFSPLPEISSTRLDTLYRLPRLEKGVLLVPVSTLMQRLPPEEFLLQNCLVLDQGDKLNLDEVRRHLEGSGYLCVPQVMEHGEFAVRGSLLDLFPMGSNIPFRIDLFDDEIESLRTFDIENQRSTDKLESVRLLPAREFPFDEAAITRFRQRFRQHFDIDPGKCIVYQEVSKGIASGGVEYYLPLFFEKTASLFDYLPEHALVLELEDCRDSATGFYTEVSERYELRRTDMERPVLAPEQLYLPPEDLLARLDPITSVVVHGYEVEPGSAAGAAFANFATSAPPVLALQARAEKPAAALQSFLDAFSGRVLFAAESTGRREVLLDTLRGFGIRPEPADSWQAFLRSGQPCSIVVAPLEQGLLINNPDIGIIAESQLFGERAQQRRRRKASGPDAENVVRNLTELHAGAPVVHEDYGVGRYLGLEKLPVGDIETEFLTLEYANSDKLYVPISSLHLISRYTGASPETAPLHRLGSDQWQRIRKRASERIRDVAAELLDIYSRRQSQQGQAFPLDKQEYAAFSAAFPFEETPDQQAAIDDVLKDMQAQAPMERVVCGDVGFGKTEVAMRAAFIAAHNGKQTAVLVPTTLLAQQHYQNFLDRFADWPVSMETLSRFRSKKEQDKIVSQLGEGKIDIVIGTHRLLQDNVKFGNLGLVIIDEEHRFGVRQKERLKKLRTQVDLLTLTATPIPRTLNMAMSGMRDLSIIATPPTHRHAIKTFVSEWSDPLISEACMREIKRGGQVYFLHNEVSSIERIARKVEELIPEARVRFAHGQMRERDLEQVMLDFYHRRFNILVCTTIIESGIDIPTANTIIINRADKLGLAQLHQLRGRVGRSHHRAYAFLLVPPRSNITADAVKRIEAIESMEDLGAGFALATHDLEIRGAGELLGEDQSGQIHEIGFTLYMDLLERAVSALKAGHRPELDQPLDQGPEVDLQTPALLPDDYLPDVHARLVMYKRLAAAANREELRELQVEMIDRFGLLPTATRNLIRVMELKLVATPLGVRKIDANPAGVRVEFQPEPKIDAGRIIQLVQQHPESYRLDGGNRLRYVQDLPEPENRADAVETLLHQLAPGPA